MPTETGSVADFAVYHKFCVVWRIVLIIAPGIFVAVAIWLFWPIESAWLSAVCYGVSGLLAIATATILSSASFSFPLHRAALRREANLFLGVALTAIFFASFFYCQ